MKYLFIILLSVLFTTQICSANKVDIKGTRINPPRPTDIDLIEIITRGKKSSGMVLLKSESDISPPVNTIDLDFYFQDSNSLDNNSKKWEKRIVLIDTLSSGIYSVTSKVWVTDEDQIDTFILADTYSTSFKVVPEPTTMLLLGIGSLIFVKRR